MQAAAAMPSAAAPAPAPEHPPAPALTSSSSSSYAAAGRNMATSRRVNRLLDITVNTQLRDLVGFVEEMEPSLFDKDAGAAAPQPGAESSTTNASTAAAAGLRRALEGQVSGMHREFLGQMKALHDTFCDVAQQVQELDRECAAIEAALGGDRSGPASAEAEALVRRVGTLQRELQYVQRRQQDVKEFQEKFNFGAEDEKVLEEGQVDARFLDVLEKAREVHRKSRALLMTKEYQQNAGAVIESTYEAITRATEKVARFLLASSGAAGAGGGGGGAGGAGGMLPSLAADVPEVSSLYLRCAAVLREESASQWEKVMEELARGRRASVLRRYFHLLTTGSATTSAGTYRAGSSGRAEDAAAAAGSSLRPLEAELNDPIFFFSSLFAWLHQSIVEEADFLDLFFRPAATPSAGVVADAAPTHVTKRGLLSFIFDGVSRHVRTAFDGVVERFAKASSVLGHQMVTSADAGAAGEEHGDGPEAAEGGAAVSAPRGLTGGLTRLLFAATGRTLGGSRPPGGSGSGGGGSAASTLQRYSAVSTRAQQEAVAATLIRGPLAGLQVCHQLLQLFAYYSAATFAPLLGRDASLTVLVAEAAGVELQRVLQQLVKFTSLHLFDSTGGAVARLPVLRRLSSAFEASREGYRGARQQQEQQEQQQEAAGEVTAPETGAEEPPNRFVLDFLFRHYALLIDGAALLPPASGGATDPQQQASALELARLLNQLILPVPPEALAFMRLVEQLLTDTARQQQMLEAIHAQQHQQQAGEEGGDADEKREEEDCEQAAAAAEPAMYLAVVLQPLLSLPALLAAQHVARGGLDEPCQCVLLLNIFTELRATLRRHEGVLEQAAGLKVSHDGGIVAVVEAELRRLEAALTGHVAAAAASHFLRQARLPEGLLRQEPAALVVGQAERQAIRTASYWLYNLYNLIASNGALPQLPLLGSVADTALAARVQAQATRHVVAEYARLFRELEGVLARAASAGIAPLNDDEAAAIVDMAPEKLSILMNP